MNKIKKLIRTIYAIICYFIAITGGLITDGLINDGLIMLPIITGFMSLATCYYALILDGILKRKNNDITIYLEDLRDE